ncbi:hypothetical protein GCM10027168_70860 [Streptomyces capparidis]
MSPRTLLHRVLSACRPSHRAARRSPGAGAGLASAAVTGAVHGAGPVNGYQLLEQVAALPVATWRYHWDPPHVRHLGPMAQDWHAAFGLGGTDKAICCTDANGVALVAIQALHRHLHDLRAQITDLRAQVTDLHTQLAGPQAAVPPPAPAADPARQVIHSA